MTYGKMRIQLYIVGNIVETKRFGKAQIIEAEYDNNLNWWDYKIKTDDFGYRTVQNDGISYCIKETSIIKNNNMSAPQFTKGQQVQIQTPHGQFNISDIVYHIGVINRICGMYSVQLLHNGVSVGALPINNLIAFKK